MIFENLKTMNLMKSLSYILIGTVFNVFSLSVLAQNNQGNCKILIDKGTVVPENVSCSFANRNKIATITQSQSILVLKKIEDLANPISDSLKQENQIGLVEPGTQIKIIGETITPNFMLNYTKIDILQGRLKGKTGWVATNAIILR
jgi:hypothetical protein